MLSSPSSPFMLPGMASAESRVVRFDEECVLIPESPRSKRRMLTKSYSLPLWKRKPTQFSDSEADESSLALNNVEETRVVLKVPIPTFSAKSHSRGRSASASPPTTKALSPCLVHRSPSAASTSHPSPSLSPVRRPSLPSHRRNRDESALTVPLRACCQGCERITEESLQGGDNWTENFSRGARRRRAASLDNNSTVSPFGTISQGFAAANLSSSSDASSSRLGSSTSAFAITVDEVDKRRRSQDLPERGTSSSPVLPSPFPTGSRYPHNRSNDRDISLESISSSTSEDLTPDGIDSRRRLRSSPIEEEDEAQLFPLPSPRRSPSGSGTPSPAASPNPSPVPSPNASTSFLGKPASCSKESVSSAPGSSEEGILKGSLSRKTADGLLSPSLSTTITADAPRPQRPTFIRSPETKELPPTPASPKDSRPPLSLSFPIPAKQPPSSPREPSQIPQESSPHQVDSASSAAKSLPLTPKQLKVTEQAAHDPVTPSRGGDALRAAERRQWDVWGSLMTLSSGVVRI